MESIQLKQDTLFRIGIKNAEGKDTGEYIAIDLEDIELPLRLQECEKQIKDNDRWLQAQQIMINKRPDKRGKKLLSANEEAIIKVLNEYYIKQTKAWELFLGEGAIAKILCGRKPYYTMFAELDEQLMPLMPKLKNNCTSIQEKIKAKYSKKESDVLE